MKRAVLIFITMIALCLQAHSQYTDTLLVYDKPEVDLKIPDKKSKNRIFEFSLASYGLLAGVAYFSDNVNNFIIPAYIVTAVGATILIRGSKRKKDKWLTQR